MTVAAPTQYSNVNLLASVNALGDTALAADAFGNFLAALGTLLAGEDTAVGVQKVEQRFGYTPLITNAGPTTTVIKSGAGYVAGISINTPVANLVIVCYDNTAASGTIIGTVTLPATLLSSGPMFWNLWSVFSTGLTLKCTTTNADLSIIWR